MEHLTHAAVHTSPVGRWLRMTGKDDDTSNDKPYPQLNLNTGVSIAVVVMVGGLFFWIGGLRGDVTNHDQRIVIVEAGVRDLRLAQGQSDTKLEGRLTRIEILLQDVLNRMADRDRAARP